MTSFPTSAPQHLLKRAKAANQSNVSRSKVLNFGKRRHTSTYDNEARVCRKKEFKKLEKNEMQHKFKKPTS